MTVIVERAIVAVVKIEAPTMKAAEQAFADLRTRVEHSLPKRRFAPCTIIEKAVRAVPIRGVGRMTP